MTLIMRLLSAPARPGFKDRTFPFCIDRSLTPSPQSNGPSEDPAGLSAGSERQRDALQHSSLSKLREGKVLFPRVDPARVACSERFTCRTSFHG
ncbi:hypothetical protein CesoFtcFv8_021466 [Champsocephalus esox]|uniref:Uncharacterized protein n=2 Tax=Champsocephalus esox TaxID=159716 RepID=A0AAN8BDT6_9TELE|nr:hypothetical protein CesoFtcFv8_021466 [Champsocephalus esox]